MEKRRLIVWAVVLACISGVTAKAGVVRTWAGDMKSNVDKRDARHATREIVDGKGVITNTEDRPGGIHSKAITLDFSKHPEGKLSLTVDNGPATVEELLVKVADTHVAEVAVTVEESSPNLVELDLRGRDSKTGEAVITKEKVDPKKIAVVVVDMWNSHGCNTCVAYLGAMVPRMNRSLECVRNLGMQVIWAPAGVVAMYAGTPQREAAIAVERRPLPESRGIPIPQFSGGGMCGPGIRCKGGPGWDAMIQGLEIEENDLISDWQDEVYSICAERGITHIIYMGVHTTACIVNRPYAMTAMANFGFTVILARDLTDAGTGYSPQIDVTPDDGTARVVAEIEKVLGPSIVMKDEMVKAGQWQDDWVVDPVKITPWGYPEWPHQFEESVIVTLRTPWNPGVKIHYTVDGSKPTEKSPHYENPITLDRTTTLRTVAFKDGRQVCLESTGYFTRLAPMPPVPDLHISDLKRFPVSRAQLQVEKEFTTDRSYADAPLRMRGKEYEKGMGVHAPASLVYKVRPEYERFVALAGIDDSIKDVSKGRLRCAYSRVVFRVFIDGKLASESPVMRTGQEPWRFSVDIPRGSRIISLSAMHGGSGCYHMDIVDWVNAGFMITSDRRQAFKRQANDENATVRRE
jgi:nicotinamidase-related amidase